MAEPRAQAMARVVAHRAQLGRRAELLGQAPADLIEKQPNERLGGLMSEGGTTRKSVAGILPSTKSRMRQSHCRVTSATTGSR